jgi:prephenate dehydratase
MMGNEKVAFLGPISSYSHQVQDFRYFTRPAWTFGLTDSDFSQAVIERFSAGDYEHVAMVTFRGIPSLKHTISRAYTEPDIFEALQKDQVSWGVVPFENSTNGSVVFTLDLLADRANQFPDILVCGEAYLDVHHYLLGHHAVEATSNESAEISRSSTPTPQTPNPQKPRAQPLSSLKHIERIYSHPQAFGQCEIFLGTYLKGIERIDVSSTSKAAELVKADTIGTSAAIASKVAAKVHGLTTLAKGIEDREDNTTRFFVLRKGLCTLKNEDASQLKKGRPATKSLVSFTVDHRSPGALADVLHCFKQYKLNLTSINSRPSRIIPFQYIFFVEFEGSKLDDPEGTVNEALKRVEKVAESCRWLGSWEDKLRKRLT